MAVAIQVAFDTLGDGDAEVDGGTEVDCDAEIDGDAEVTFTNVRRPPPWQPPYT